MADFTSAAQFVGRPQVQLEDPMQAQMKAASLAQAMQQQQLGALQLGEAKRAAENRDYLQTAIQQGMDPYQAMINRGMYKEAKDYQASRWNEEKAKHDAQKANFESISAKAGRLAQLTSGVTDQASYDKALATAKSEGFELGSVNPVYNSDEVKAFQTQALSAKDQVDAQLRRMEIERKTNEPGSQIGKLKQDFQTGKINKQEYDAEMRKLTNVPYGSVSTYGGGGGVSGGGAVGGGGVSAARSDAQILADKLRKGEAQWPTSMTVRTDPIMREALNIARRDEPGFDEGTYKQRQNAIKDLDTGKLGTSKNAIMTIFGHLGHLADAYGQLPDYGLRGVNWAAQTLKEYGPGGNPILQEVKDIQEAIGPEMSRVYMPTGQGSVTERTGWKERINPARPDAERKANLGAFGELLVTRLNQNYEQAKQSMKGIPEDQWPRRIELSQDAYEALKKIESYTGKPIKGADRWIKDYEKTNGIESTAKSTSPMLPYQGKSATMDQIKASGASKGWDEATAKRKWIEGGGKVVQ